MTAERDYTPEQQRRDGWLVAIFVTSALALIAAVIGVGFGARAIDESKAKLDTTDGAPVGAATSAMVHLSEFAIDPFAVSIARGGTLTVMNAGTTAHNLAIKKSQLKTAMVDPGGSAELNVGELA